MGDAGVSGNGIEFNGYTERNTVERSECGMIRVSDIALDKIRDILQEEPETTVIRMNVTPG
jgi:hypothetical protein